ncbi:MAG: 1-acyl-sn-glycerol-3-phosphate acyltransferase [Phycisphaerales bacterium]|nr:1-acyl-sn-glycerol-3-phosphate acyltransferase [Phycisphaerales bacterium]
MLSALQFGRRSNWFGWFSLLFWWTTISFVVRTIFGFVWGLRCSGRAHLPASGPVLVVSNHQSHFDPMLTGSLLCDRAPRSLARRSLIDGAGIPGWLIGTAYGSIPIEQGQDDTAAMRAMINELKQGRVATIYPEGSRFADGRVHEFQRGAWVLIKRGGAPVLPMGVAGTGDIWPPGQSRPRLGGRMGVCIGAPIPCEELLELGEEAALERLHAEVTRLSEEARWWA